MFATLILFAMFHPFHRSLAEVAWNAESERYEVSLRVDPIDLDAALSTQEQRRIVLDKLQPADANGMLKKYIAKHLRPQRSEQQIGEVHWVGYETDDRGKYVWLYFEWSRPAGEGPLRLHNRLFMREEPTHISTVVFTDLAKRPALIFTKQKALLPMP